MNFFGMWNTSITKLRKQGGRGGVFQKCLSFLTTFYSQPQKLWFIQCGQLFFRYLDIWSKISCLKQFYSITKTLLLLSLHTHTPPKRVLKSRWMWILIQYWIGLLWSPRVEGSKWFSFIQLHFVRCLQEMISNCGMNEKYGQVKGNLMVQWEDRNCSVVVTSLAKVNFL